MAPKTDRRHGERRARNMTPSSERRAGQDRRALDRRQAVRAPIDLWMEEAHGEDLYFRRVGNLSLGGVFFENTIPHKPGTNVTLKFSVPGHERIIEAQGLVVSATNADKSFGMGVRFTSLDAQDRRLLESYIHEVTQSPHRSGDEVSDQ